MKMAKALRVYMGVVMMFEVAMWAHKMEVLRKQMMYACCEPTVVWTDEVMNETRTTVGVETTLLVVPAH